MKIEKLACQFRNALDIAYENRELNKYPPFSIFPNECCDLTCDLLGKYLSDNDIVTYQVNGECEEGIS